MSTVLVLSANHVPEVTEVLCESFADYPVMRYVLGDSGEQYTGRLTKLIRFFVMARVLRSEVLLGIPDGATLGGVALVSDPGSRDSPPALATLREAVWSELGADARTRYETFGAACAEFGVDAPHIHLNMIGVRSGRRSRGLGRRLLDCVHRMSAADDASEGVSLTTEDAANVPLYEHFGYEVVGHSSVAPGLESWSMFRRDRVGAG